MAKEINEVRIRPDGEGGHAVHIDFKSEERTGKHGVQPIYHEPDFKAFGADEGHDMLAHVANHLNIPEMTEK